MVKTILQQRLKTLYEKCRLIASTDLHEIGKYDYETYSGWMTTVYGDRGFLIKPNGNFTYTEIVHDRNYELRKPIFEITFFWGGDVNIQPIVNMTGHEIDMAIYEIEQSVEKSYKKACKLIDKHSAAERYFNKQRC